MGSVRTPIIGRPRPLPGHRRAQHDYTLVWDEPAKSGHTSPLTPPVSHGSNPKLAGVHVLLLGRWPWFSIQTARNPDSSLKTVRARRSP